jgi:AcrR family transcriptional regulator
VTDLEARAPGRRDRKKQQTRAALVAAALRLVDARGLERVTVEEISEAADVSPRTFFNYFASKDEAIIGDPLADDADTRERLASVPPDVPVIEALLHALAPAIAQIQADREIWFIRMRVIENNPLLLPALHARGAIAEREFIAAITERVGAAPDSGYPQVAAAVIGAAFRAALLRWAACDAARPLSEFVHEAFGMVAAGLAVPTNERV